MSTDASSIIGEGHEKRASMEGSQERMPPTPCPVGNREGYNFPRATLTEVCRDDPSQWDNQEEGEEGGDLAASISTRQGPPSFAQSEFYTVYIIYPPHVLMCLSSLCATAFLFFLPYRLSVVNAVNAVEIISR